MAAPLVAVLPVKFVPPVTVIGVPERPNAPPVPPVLLEYVPPMTVTEPPAAPMAPPRPDGVVAGATGFATALPVAVTLLRVSAEFNPATAAPLPAFVETLAPESVMSF